MILDTFQNVFVREQRESLVLGNAGKFPVSSDIWAGPWTEMNLDREESMRYVAKVGIMGSFAGDGESSGSSLTT